MSIGLYQPIIAVTSARIFRYFKRQVLRRVLKRVLVETGKWATYTVSQKHDTDVAY